MQPVKRVAIALLCTSTPLLAAPLFAAEDLFITQAEINQLTAAGKTQEAFDFAFEAGDELFEHNFIAAQGGGANVGNGQRFTLVPRADLTTEGAWATHFPARSTGPNAQSCATCHNLPFGDGAGDVSQNNIRDPEMTGDISKFINRQPPHIFGIGALQLLAEEMTTELQQQRDAALAKAQETGADVPISLVSKGVSFGTLIAQPDGFVITSAIDGIDSDLVLKPLEWKGLTGSVRAFVRDAGHNELGMQAVEITGPGQDGDGDGVADELSVGDITALTIYQAAQPRPVTRVELARLGLIEALSARETTQIARGAQVFASTGCNVCHIPQMTLENSVYSEPSQNALYRDALFPAKTDPVALGLSPALAITFDLTSDLPDNVIERQDGSVLRLGDFQTDDQGRGIVALFSDLKRHDMGPALAEAVAEKGIAANQFITQELWGVGSTPPYMHDGRATTLGEAIAWHGGEAAASVNDFRAASVEDKLALIAYLENLVLYKVEED
ncbi:di-heme oxidoredictase family protein [Candidatus Halocynthiibacter alkanivorans]|uniref:di-heme oxidoredictase family protein n=1 Tax=Candidatus Halocynthiibacter alkanivorans TaxID=2267619 RepID=UPI00135683ED|nr:di-heme oxidoredictase family protein [Candidatus Halocynthiibacter alkanivorans]